jgi:hypothetical protein
MFGLTQKEQATLSRLSTPRKIQDFLDRIPINFEKQGDTHMSPPPRCGSTANRRSSST